MAGATENYPDEDNIEIENDALMRKGKGKGKKDPDALLLKGKGMGWSHETMEGQFQGPQPVPDDDGLENLLVHVIGVSGEWMWSEVLPEHLSMTKVQQLFENSDRKRFGLVDGQRYRLLYQFRRDGPYPYGFDRAGCYGPWPDSPVYSLRVHLGAVTGITRSIETREVWITAVRVLVI